MRPLPVFDHLARLSGPYGLFEHARITEPRTEHGYCLDDTARALVVVAREPEPDATVAALHRSYLDFVLAAQDPDGRFRNRRDRDGRWTDDASVADHWGRAIWALGTEAVHGDAVGRARALQAADRAMAHRSPWWHAMAYAALGAAEVLRVHPDAGAARAAHGLLVDARTLLAAGPGEWDGLDASVGLVGPVGSGGSVRSAGEDWPWPEARLRYANGLLPEALVAVGTALGDAAVLARGLELLRWLVDLETRDGHLSLTPVGGRGAGEPRPGFDQQPIEVTALAEACWRAFDATGDESWRREIDRCVAWFGGDNDIGAALYDTATGGGRDGLEAHGANENQGAESTLAALATLQLGRLAALTATRP